MKEGRRRKKNKIKKPSFDFGKLPAINAIPSPLTQSFSSLVSRLNVPPSSQQPAVSSQQWRPLGRGGAGRLLCWIIFLNEASEPHHLELHQ